MGGARQGDRVVTKNRRVGLESHARNLARDECQSFRDTRTKHLGVRDRCAPQVSWFFITRPGRVPRDVTAHHPARVRRLPVCSSATGSAPRHFRPSHNPSCFRKANDPGECQYGGRRTESRRPEDADGCPGPWDNCCTSPASGPGFSSNRSLQSGPPAAKLDVAWQEEQDIWLLFSTRIGSARQEAKNCLKDVLAFPRCDHGV